MIITNSHYALVGYFITSYSTRAQGIIVIYDYHYQHSLTHFRQHINQYLTNAQPLLDPQLADIGLVLVKFWSSVSQYTSEYISDDITSAGTTHSKYDPNIWFANNLLFLRAAIFIIRKSWWEQFSLILVKPNRFCQPTAFGTIWKFEIHQCKNEL